MEIGCLPPRALGSSRGRQNNNVRAGAWSLVSSVEQEGLPGLSLSCSSCSSTSCSQSVAAGRCLEQRQGEEESPSLENALQKSWPPPLSPPQRSPPHLHPACGLFSESPDPRHISQLLTVPWARPWMPDKDPRHSPAGLPLPPRPSFSFFPNSCLPVATLDSGGVSLTSFLLDVQVEWVPQPQSLHGEDLSPWSEAQKSQGYIFPSSERSPLAAAVNSYRDPDSPRSNLKFGMSNVHRVWALGIPVASRDHLPVPIRGNEWDTVKWRWRRVYSRWRLPPELSPGSQRSQCSIRGQSMLSAR